MHLTPSRYVHLSCLSSVCVFSLVEILKHFVPVDFIYQFIFLFIVLNVI